MLLIPKAHLPKKLFYGKFIFLMCFLYILSFIFETMYIEIVYSTVILLVFMISLWKANKILSFFSVGMAITGIIIIVLKGGGVEELSTGIKVNIPILTLMLLAPLISIPFRLGGYLYPIQAYLIKIYKNSNKFFLLTTIFIFFIGPIMSLGVIKILHDLIEDFKVNPEFLAKSYLGGYSTVVIWSPYHASVALVLYYLDVSIREYFPLALGLSLILLVILNGLYRISKKKQPDDITLIDHIEGSKHRSHHSLKRLLILVFFLMGLILSVEYVTKWPMVFIVSLTAILFPLIWSLVKKRIESTLIEFNKFSENLAGKSNNEVVLFISAGLLGTALKDTWILERFHFLLGTIYEESYFIFMLFIIFIIILFTFIGIHQVVIVTALLIQIDPETMGTSSVLLALLFMLAWSLSAVLSPVNPLNIIVSNLVNRRGIILGAKLNGVYLFLMVLVGCAYIYILHLFIDGVV
ncbi:hypothetical protein [Mesobacillus maritimus]|uniref:hypothetical protein n=1 Tax=Mesobacillus maritimus TaxID=1643336 RepID=UPI00384BA994